MQVTLFISFSTKYEMELFSLGEPRYIVVARFFFSPIHNAS